MNNKGFTLIEIIIVIVILGIMAALALPNITGSIARGRIPGALEQMGKMQREMDMCLQVSGDVDECADLTALGYATDPIVIGNWTYTSDDEGLTADCNNCPGGAAGIWFEWTKTVNGLTIDKKEGTGTFVSFKFRD